MIPFVLGVITVIEGATSVCMPIPLSLNNDTMGNNSPQLSVVNATQYQDQSRKTGTEYENEGFLTFK